MVLREFSVASSPVMETVTSAVGAASRTTVNVEEPPASVVRRFPEPSVGSGLGNGDAVGVVVSVLNGGCC